ncbi:hypothetical protein Glove_221g68 [Diversispora epigaea]|uniref:Protein PBN1 n=1 Tax=Diversispora epigaea TaxID=1348612 RepID=A0A397IFJ0_9GLOM|nr:hypothetical protein Glove_221g68 [Diversispora epigaea]
MNLIQILLVISIYLLISVLKVYSLSKHRHSFFLDDEALNWFDQDAIQTIGDQKVRILNFTGVKEWKVLIPLEELLKSRSNLKLPVMNDNNEWKIRVQIVPRNRPRPPYPFNIIPATGIHVGFSVGNNSFESLDHKNPDFNTVCKYLDALFGFFNCDDDEQFPKGMFIVNLKNSISLPRGNFYHYSNFPTLHHHYYQHHQIPTRISILGEMLMNKKIKDYLVLDFELKFNENNSKENSSKILMTELRIVEISKNQDIEISKEKKENDESDEEKVEIGIFGPQIDEESFIGGRIIIGKNNDKNNKNNKNIVPSMIKVIPRTLSTDLFYFNFSINHNQGFHPKFNTSITLLKPLPIQKSQENCQLYLLHTFPNSFYVDIYHLNELYPEKFIKVWGEKDLEIPVGFSSSSSSSPLKWGSLVLVNENIFERNNNNNDDNNNNNNNNNNDNNNNTNSEFILPVHMRYHQAVPENDQKTHKIIESSRPMVVCACDDEFNDDDDDDDKFDKFVNNNNNNNNNNSNNEKSAHHLFSPTPLPFSLIFPSNIKLLYILSKERDNNNNNNNNKNINYNYNNNINNYLVKIPVGKLSHLQLIEVWTVFITIASSLWIILVINQQRSVVQYYNDKLD